MFKPNIYVKHVSQMDLEKLKVNKVKLLCFDLDNTLDIPDCETKEIEPEIAKFLDEVEAAGFEVLIISNNSIKNRVASFADLRGYNYIEWARKPFQKQYKKSSIISKYEKHEVCFIGDKIVTDVIGGNLFGSYTVLVDPLYPNKKHWYTNIMNFAERSFCTLVKFKRGVYYDNM